jgi:hypothetical protein
VKILSFISIETEKEKEKEKLRVWELFYQTEKLSHQDNEKRFSDSKKRYKIFRVKFSTEKIS